jgi:hypothetical protein
MRESIETTLLAEAEKPSRPSLIHDPNWVERIPNENLRLPVKVAGDFIGLLFGLLTIAVIGGFVVIALFVLLRVLHAAWGY